MATFASVTFSERGRANGTFFPVHGARCRYAVLPAPGGTNIYLQLLGADAAPFDLPVRVTASQLASLRTKVAQSGTLSYVGGNITATLVDVADVVEVKRPNDHYFATLRFLTTDTSGASASAFLTEGGDTFTTEGGDALVVE